MNKFLLLIIFLAIPTITLAAFVPLNSFQTGNNPVNGYYLKTDGNISTWAAVVGGGGSGDSVWSRLTTTGTIYTPTTTDAVAIGANATSSAEFWFDPGLNSGNGIAYIKGLLGIGTTTPPQKLSVSGSGLFDGGLVNASYFTATSTVTANTFPYASTTMISATTASTTNLNLSIPSSLLKTVTGIVTAASLGTDYVNGSGTSGNCVQWGAANALTDAGAACGTGSGGGGGNSKWATSTDTTSIYLNSATKVGIGTTTPTRLLNLTSSNGLSQLKLEDTLAAANFHAHGIKSMLGDFFISSMSDIDVATTRLTIASTTAGVTGTTTSSDHFNIAGDLTAPSSYLGSLQLDTNAGAVNAINMPLVAGPLAGTLEGYSFTVGDVATSSINLGCEHTGATASTKNCSVTIGSTTNPGYAKLVIYGQPNENMPVFVVATSSATTLATSTAFIIDSNGQIGIGTTTTSGANTPLSVGNDSNASTTIMWGGKYQIDTYDNAGTRICAFFVGTTFTASSGACNQ